MRIICASYGFIHKPYGQAWAADLRLLLRLAHRLKQGHGPPLTDTLKARLEQWYDQLLAAGETELPADPPSLRGRRGRRTQHPARNLHQRLRHYKSETLRFLHHPEVPFDNNGAERDLCMIKAQQKVSGTFRRLTGRRPALCQPPQLYLHGPQAGSTGAGGPAFGVYRPALDARH